MKKLFSTLLLLILGVSLLAFTACGKEDGKGIEGTYEFQTVVFGGQTYEVGDEAPWGEQTLSKDCFTVTLKKDGTWTSVANMGDQGVTEDAGTWSNDNGVFVMVSNTTGNANATLVGDIISMTHNYGTEITYTFKKA